MPSIHKTLDLSPNSETEIRKFRSRESDTESAGHVCFSLAVALKLVCVCGCRLCMAMLRMCAVFMKPERAWIP